MKATAASSLLLCLLPVGYSFVIHAPALRASSLYNDCRSSALSRPQHVGGQRVGAAPRMAWGDDVVWSKATITETSEVAKGQHILKVQSGDIAKEYKVPGQFVQIKVGDDGKPGFFAIANAPTDVDENGTLDFLVKAVDSTVPLVSAAAGSSVQMSPIMGKGFPIEENMKGFKYDWPVQNVILTATGTGIAPMRAAIESGELELPEEENTGLFGRTCTLYWGCRNEETMPMTDKLAEWEASGVKVVRVLSEPSSSWTGRKGYVQQALKEDGVRVPRNTAVLMCGQKEMAEDVKEICYEAGVLDGRCLTNF